MQCGCAPVCTNIGGYMVTCKDGQTALLGEVGNAESLASKILELIENDELRCRIANNANTFIKQYTWESAYRTFKNILVLQ
jgi:glycosyltransferase involved in cell wall biosynthesis